MLRKLYDKSLDIASSKKSISFLGFISFIESFIFPIPPDVMIIPMTIAKKKNWLRIATVATIGSVCGAIVGYIIGYVFFNEIGLKIFELYGVDNVSFLKDKVSSDGGTITWITLLAIAGFTPVPFKLLTITSGFVHFNIFYFIIVSALTRGSRFFLVALLIRYFGPAIKEAIEKRLLLASLIFSLVIIVVALLLYNYLKNF
ncbi:MAG: YqaA family protein [Candidatus Pelagibacter sp.]